MLQGSPEWLMARCGKATASEFASILAKGEGKTRAKYLRRLIAERLTGKPMETYTNGHMERGKEQEPYARMSYEELTGRIVQEVAIVDHPTLKAACSPDGLIADDGGAEIKSVIPTVQVETILRGGYPPEHKAQIQGSLWITGRAYWDFCSYSPDMPERLRCYIFRVERDEEYIKKLETEVTAFLCEVETMIAKLSA